MKDTNMNKSQECRVAASNIEYRAEGDSAPVISGYAALFGVPSQDLGGFVEVIAPGAFTTIATDDIRLLMNHDDDEGPLARTSSGTMSVKVDNKGLYFEATLDPSDPDAQRMLTKIRRKDITQVSFGFQCRSDKWVNDNGVITRQLLDVEICDISPCTYPAYLQTNVSVRSFEKFKAEQEELQKARDAAKVKPVSVILSLIME